jgi:predicted permease
METLLRDLRYSARALLQSPGFSTVAVLSLALGMGVNTAIFSVYNAIFLRALPVDAPEELVDVYAGDSVLEFGPLSYPDYLDLRAQTSEVFSDMVAYDISIGVYEHGNESEYMYGEAVTGNYFSMLGIDATYGRTFIAGTDDAEGAQPTVVLSYQVWRDRFGSSEQVLGRSFRLSGVEYTIVGIAAEDFKGLLPMSAAFWVPITQDPMIGGGLASLDDRDHRFLFSTKGRLLPEITFEEARAAVATVGERLAEAYPDSNSDVPFVALRTEDVGIHAMLDTPVRLFTLLLMGMVGLALLIACTNLASMLLARATQRRRETAVRLALGAGRRRLIRQLVTESVMLSLVGGLVGLLVATWLLSALLAVQPPFPIPLGFELGIDRGVLLFTAALSLATGVVFGLIPALQSTRLSLVEAIKGESPVSGRRGGRMRLRSALVIGQVAVSMVLLVCTGLFLRSLANASAIEPGFDLRRGLVAVIDTSVADYSVEETQTFFGELRSRIESMPGVDSAALIRSLPLGPGITTTRAIPESAISDPEAEGIPADETAIGVNYFSTLKIPLLRGRDFLSSDTAESLPVAIVNQTLAQRLWPDQSAIGQRLKVEYRGDELFEVVGVAANGKYRTLGEDPRAFVYIPFAQSSDRRMSVVASTSVDPGTLFAALRAEVRSLDPNLPVFDLKTIAEHMQIMLFVPRLIAALVGGLGSLAMLLGVIGLYGIVAYSVARRTREVGIRMALGARRSDVVRQIVAEGMRRVVYGVALGLGLALLATRMLGAWLYEISPTDPVTFCGIAALLFAVAFLAAYGPARRAARLDPMVALRRE